MSAKRKIKVVRKTKETSIVLEIGLDGKGAYRIKTPIPFLNHMLELFSKHGLFDLSLSALGDTEVDDHHLVEDIGICLGEAFDQLLQKKEGIRRYGFFTLPMDEVLTTVAIDFCGRPSFAYQTPIKTGRIKNFDLELVEHFFESFVHAAKINLHILVHYGKIKHHIVESVFKAFARAIDMATQIDPRVKGVPSTKGVL
ncbi:MAG: imidazoleglycerol-phosphate dehydratase HisB [Deltaproteobacteria bacterium]|nr:imidazoleglycerol-phosphate dehydratase HisB [Deltaproteobacteria bacterium]MBI2501499.1 imidazoleglycerol-phosphate dehydratase HisB [Deltaproteobacteria bacterium]